MLLSQSHRILGEEPTPVTLSQTPTEEGGRDDQYPVTPELTITSIQPAKVLS